MPHERPPRYADLLKEAGITTEPEEKTVGISCCDGSPNNPGLTHEGVPCRKTHWHDNYWVLHDTLRGGGERYVFVVPARMVQRLVADGGWLYDKSSDYVLSPNGPVVEVRARGRNLDREIADYLLLVQPTAAKRAVALTHHELDTLSEALDELEKTDFEDTPGQHATHYASIREKLAALR